MARRKKVEVVLPKVEKTYSLNVEYRSSVEILNILAESEEDAKLKAMFQANESYGWPAERMLVTITKVV